MRVGVASLTRAASAAARRAVAGAALLASSGCVSPVEGLRIEPAAPTTADDLVVAPGPGEGDVWAYRWSRDGEVQTDLIGNVVPAGRTARGERWSVVVERIRGQRASDPARLDVEIGNAPPAVAAGIAEGADGLAAIVRADDPDADAVVTGWVWSRGDQTQTGGAVPRASLTAGDVWTLTATATDTDGASASVAVTHTVGEQPPAVLFAQILPDPASASDTLTVDVDLDDPDGDAMTPTIRWTLNGDDVHVGPSLAAGTAARGDIVMAWVSVDDGAERSAELPTAPLRISNSPPSLEGVVVEPPVLAAGLSARCEAVGWIDADGEPPLVRTRWFVDGVLATEGPGLNSAYFAKGATVTCEGTPVDAEGFGETATSPPVPVLDTPPALARVELHPEPPTAADDVEVVPIGADDADGDLVSFDVIWSVDGAFAGTGPVLSSSLTRGQQVAVAVTPSDGELDGVTLFYGPIEVANAAPVVRSAALSPPVAGQDVTLTYDADDADGDPLTATIRWRIDGGNWFTNDRLPGAQVVTGAAVEAEVTVSDADASSAPLIVGPVTVP